MDDSLGGGTGSRPLARTVSDLYSYPSGRADLSGRTQWATTVVDELDFAGPVPDTGAVSPLPPRHTIEGAHSPPLVARSATRVRPQPGAQRGQLLLSDRSLTMNLFDLRRELDPPAMVPLHRGEPGQVEAVETELTRTSAFLLHQQGGTARPTRCPAPTSPPSASPWAETPTPGRAPTGSRPPPHHPAHPCHQGAVGA